MKNTQLVRVLALACPGVFAGSPNEHRLKVTSPLLLPEPINPFSGVPITIRNYKSINQREDDSARTLCAAEIRWCLKYGCHMTRESREEECLSAEGSGRR